MNEERKPERRPEVTNKIVSAGYWDEGKILGYNWYCPICKKGVKIGAPCCGWNQEGYKLSPESQARKDKNTECVNKLSAKIQQEIDESPQETTIKRPYP